MVQLAALIPQPRLFPPHYQQKSHHAAVRLLEIPRRLLADNSLRNIGFQGTFPMGSWPSDWPRTLQAQSCRFPTPSSTLILTLPLPSSSSLIGIRTTRARVARLLPHTASKSHQAPSGEREKRGLSPISEGFVRVIVSRPAKCFLVFIMKRHRPFYLVHARPQSWRKAPSQPYLAHFIISSRNRH